MEPPSGGNNLRFQQPKSKPGARSCPQFMTHLAFDPYKKPKNQPYDHSNLTSSQNNLCQTPNSNLKKTISIIRNDCSKNKPQIKTKNTSKE